MLETFKNATADVLAAITEEKKLRKTNEVFLLFSLGSQFDHLIKQKLDALGVYCLVADPASVSADDVIKVKPIGIILSGGPASAHNEPPPFDGKIFDLGIPVLGICLGFQMWSRHVGAVVTPSDKREFGTHDFTVTDGSVLFEGLPKKFKVLESHGDNIETNDKLKILGITENAPVAAGEYQHLYGVQFHPEVTDTEHGEKIYANFCFKICQAKDQFPAGEVAKQKIADLNNQIGGKKVLLALSGGTDSSVVAYLLKAALTSSDTLSVPTDVGASPPKGEKNKVLRSIRGVYIKGIDRPDDEANVIKYFGQASWLELKIVDATKEFLSALKNKVTMKDKRLAMREVYKKVLEDEAKKFKAGFIAQGTLYTDISETGGGYDSGARKAQIKIHHNVDLKFSLPEIQPLSDCVKDTGRNIGKSIGVPEELLLRHPFPGPGLVVRIEGEVTAEKLATARAVDGIYIEELKKWGNPDSPPQHSPQKSKIFGEPREGGARGGTTSLYDEVWQAGAVVTASNTTATKGDDAAEGHVIALWAVWSVNGFTARAAELPYEFLKLVSRRITNEIREVGCVVYRISDKPPVTIEWG